MSALPVLDGFIHITPEGDENVVGRGTEPVHAMIPAVIFRFRGGRAVLPYDLYPAEHAHLNYEPRRRLYNTLAQEGLDQCLCGSKYWENDTCVDCGNVVIARINGEPVFA